MSVCRLITLITLHLGVYLVGNWGTLINVAHALIVILGLIHFTHLHVHTLWSCSVTSTTVRSWAC